MLDDPMEDTRTNTLTSYIWSVRAFLQDDRKAVFQRILFQSADEVKLNLWQVGRVRFVEQYEY